MSLAYLSCQSSRSRFLGVAGEGEARFTLGCVSGQVPEKAGWSEPMAPDWGPLLEMGGSIPCLIQKEQSSGGRFHCPDRQRWTVQLGWKTYFT